MTVPAPTRQTGTCTPTSRPKRAWQAPVLDALGAWRALTLQQSIPIGPGGFGHLSPRTSADGERLA